MLKRTSKKLAIMLVLSMLATMFIGVGAASAATYGVVSTPTVVNNDTPQNLGTITIDIPVLEVKNQSLLVTLPTDFEMPMAAGAYVNAPVVSVSDTSKGQETKLEAQATVVPVSDREFKVNIATAATWTADTDVLILVTLPLVKVPSAADGDITATLTALAGNFTSGSVVVGKASSGSVTASVASTATISESGSASAIEINFKENTTAAIALNDVIKVKLPKGFTWDNATITNLTTGATNADLTTVAGDVNLDSDGNVEFILDDTVDNGRTLKITRNDNAQGKSIYRIAADIDVDEDDATIGDVTVTISGDSTISPTSFVVGTYVDYGVTAKVVGDVETIKAGQIEQEVADFNIEETAAGSLLADRNIYLELPSGAKWSDININPSWGALNAAPAVSNDGRTLKFSMNSQSGSKGKIKMTNVEVMTAVDFAGDLTVTVSGAAIEETALVLAKVEPAITVAVADVADIKIGLQDQEMGDITITEAVAETLIENGELVLTLPNGVEWSAVPTVEVTEGDLEIDDNDIDINDEVLTIGIDAASSTASTITISDIKVDVNRTVSEGKIKLEVTGTAVDEVNDQNTIGALVGAFVAPNSDGELFPRNTEAAEIVVAKCVTPAENQVINETKFVIGATTYTVNGKEVTMDVAPYIANDRTYMPVRYIANAMGIDDNNILWDATTQTVTLMGANKVVQLKIGSATIMVNGAAIAMDVAPEITNSRTMLPARFVAQAFGYNVGWDEATQTVTLN